MKVFQATINDKFSIWKFSFKNGKTEIEMPQVGYHFRNLSVQQHCIWFNGIDILIMLQKPTISHPI